jgi:hypothetical protein
MATVLAASVPSYHTPSIPAYPRRLRPLPQPPALKIAPVPAAPPVRTPKARLLHTSTTTPIKKHELYPTLTLLVNNYDEEDSLIRDDFAPPPLKRTGTVPLPPISPIWAAPVTLSPRTVKFHAHVTTTAECCSQTLALLEPVRLSPAFHSPNTDEAPSSHRASHLPCMLSVAHSRQSSKLSACMRVQRLPRSTRRLVRFAGSASARAQMPTTLEHTQTHSMRLPRTSAPLRNRSRRHEHSPFISASP